MKNLSMLPLLDFPRNLPTTSPYQAYQTRDRPASKSEGGPQAGGDGGPAQAQAQANPDTTETILSRAQQNNAIAVNVVAGAREGQNAPNVNPTKLKGTGVPPTPIHHPYITSPQLSNQSSLPKTQQSEQMVSATLWLEHARAEFAKSESDIRRLIDGGPGGDQHGDQHEKTTSGVSIPPIDDSEALLKACIKRMVVHLGLKAAHAAVQAITFSEQRWSTSPPPLPSFHLPAYAVQSEMNAGNLDPNTMLYPASQQTPNANAKANTNDVPEPQTAESITNQLLRLLNEAQVARFHAEEKSRDSGIPLFATTGMETEDGPDCPRDGLLGGQDVITYCSQPPFQKTLLTSSPFISDPLFETMHSPTSPFGAGRFNSLFPMGSLPPLQEGDDLINDPIFFKFNSNLQQTEFLQMDADHCPLLETPQALQWTAAAGYDDVQHTMRSGHVIDNDDLPVGAADKPWTVEELVKGETEQEGEQNEKGGGGGEASVEADYAEEVVQSIKAQRKGMGLCDRHLHCTRRAGHRGQCRLAADAYRALIEAGSGLSSRPKPRGAALCSPGNVSAVVTTENGPSEGAMDLQKSTALETSDRQKRRINKGKDSNEKPRKRRRIKIRNETGNGNGKSGDSQGAGEAERESEGDDEERSAVTVEDLDDIRARGGGYCEKSALCHNVKGHRGRCSKGTVRWSEAVTSLSPSRRLHQEFMACFYIWFHTLARETCSKGLPLTEWKALKITHMQQLETLEVGILDARAEACVLCWDRKSIVGFHSPHCRAKNLCSHHQRHPGRGIEDGDLRIELFGDRLHSLLTNIKATYSIAALPFPKRSREDGLSMDIGVYATRHVVPGELIMELIGEWITAEEATRRAAKYVEESPGGSGRDSRAWVQGRMPNYVCGKVPIVSTSDHHLGCGDRYMVYVTDDAVLDATCAGSAARFINHSNKPTAKMYAVTNQTQKDPPRIFVIASSELKVGQEITIDYFCQT